MACEGILTDDILFDCENPMVGGIEVDVCLFNTEDIDYAGCTVSPTNKVLLTNFKLKAGKTGYLIQGVKQVQKGRSELVEKENGPNKHKHLFTGVVLNYSAENKLQLQNMSEGNTFVAIIQLKWKGEGNAEAFQMLGFRSGLTMRAMTWDTKENDGQVLFDLANLDGYEEPTLPMTVLETNYTTTLAAFTNKWAEA
jgi:hypothetical protein